MDITSGLLDHMVLQRTPRGVCDVAFSGRAQGTGRVEAGVSAKGRAVRGFGRKVVGRVRNGRLNGRLTDLPTGGPYEIALRVVDRSGQVTDRHIVRDVLVGDVWILGGQSNMQGCGLLPGVKPKNLVRAFYMDDHWAPAEDPIHNLSVAIDPVHGAICGVPPAPNSITGVGPGVAFGQEMQRLTGIPQGLLACAHGGTSMAQWDPKLKSRRGGSLYGAALRRFQKNGRRVAGILWYQGCSETSPQAAQAFSKKMKQLVAAFRRDLGDARLPFVMVQIASYCPAGTHDNVSWNSIQEQQRRLPEAIDRCLTVPAIDLGLDDSIHISSADQLRLGRRLADAVCAMTKLAPGHKPPIDLAKVRIRKDRIRKPWANIEITWRNVVGSLKAAGRPSGFALSNRIGRQCNAIYQTNLQGNSVLLKTSSTVADLSRFNLHYGLGINPGCNITDEADRSLPVFGPHIPGRPRIVGPYVQCLRTTKLLPSAGTLKSLKRMDTRDRRLGWKRREFPTEFCHRHEELAALTPKDVLVGFACAFRCSERMKLAIHLGYDGPVKAWIDGKPVLYDPKGTNPAMPEDATLKLNASVGRHEIVIALGSNFGKAWGVFLCLERLDIRRSVLTESPPRSVMMPEILG